MNRVLGITKEQMLDFLKQGYTTRKIGKLTGFSNAQISYIVRQYGLQGYYQKPKHEPFHLDQIDSKELAYTLGFIIADGAIDQKEVMKLTVAVADAELMELFSQVLNIDYRIDMTYDKEARRFPRVRLSRKIIGISKFTGGFKKKQRNVPIIARELEPYMLRGIFDADGCITWGYRKDRNRIWHKVSFSSSLSILITVQKILYKIGITTIVRPKSDEDCFVLEFANKPDVLKFYDYLYADQSFIPLKRKFNKYNALRLELGELRGTVDNDTILSKVTDLSVKCAETTGELNGTLNNQVSAQGSKELRYSPNGGIND